MNKEEIKQTISSMPRVELEKILLKILARESDLRDTIVLNYLDPEFGQENYYLKIKDKLESLKTKPQKGHSFEKKTTHYLRDCSKLISKYGRISKNHINECDLMVATLDPIFNNHTKNLGKSYKSFDIRLAMLVERLMKTVKTKLHEDYFIEYEPKINGYISTLKQYSAHIERVANLPKSF
ncbi:MAG: hypothetical protein SFY32_11530 [Bacteroidota bacterium]|nr:hypothetical protein [Bacteroidota bacterium]